MGNWASNTAKTVGTWATNTAKAVGNFFSPSSNSTAQSSGTAGHTASVANRPSGGGGGILASSGGAVPAAAAVSHYQRTNQDGTVTLLPEHFSNVVAASVEYSRVTCSASMQHVSEQKENKVSWLDQLGSWWDKNGTTIITGAIAVGVGAMAIATVIATAGTGLPILAATSSTLAALAGATVATAGSIAMMTGTASILSTLPGLDKVYGPTVNTAGFQELQMVSVVVASMGTAYLWQLDSVAQSANAQTPKTQEQTSTKVKEEITETENTAGENAGQVQETEAVLNEEGVSTGTETFYRTMSEADYETFLKTGKIPATNETFISPTQSFSEDYSGVTVEFKVKTGTTAQLVDVGVRDSSSIVKDAYGSMPTVGKGWSTSGAYFKGEGSQINIGLGKGTGLDIFNNNIVDYEVVGGK